MLVLSKYQLDKKLIKACRRILAMSNITVYHGSDKKIDRFKTGIKTYRFLLFKRFEQYSQGIFFAFTSKETKEYGTFVYKITINNPKLFIGINDKNVGVDRLDSKREKELCAMLLTIAKNTDNGKVINLYKSDIHIPDDFKSNLDWIYEAIGSGGIVWDVLDESNFVKKMKEFGYDGTLVDEPDMDSRKSLFIHNLDIIGTPILLDGEDGDE